MLSVINIAKIFASYNTYTLPCSTPCVSCGCIDTQPLECGLGSMQLRTELFATKTFQHDKPLTSDNVDCHALFPMNVPRNYHLALLPLSPLLQTLHPDIFWRWLYEAFEIMDNWMEGQEGESNDAITLSALSPAVREFICRSEIPISVVDLLNDVARTPRYQLSIRPSANICYCSMRSHP